MDVTQTLLLPKSSKAAGDRLFCRTWTPDGSPKAIVLLAHGLAEHVGRYEHVAAELCAAGYAVTGIDHWGHGRSGGEPGFVPAFSVYLDGMATLLAWTRTQNPRTPLFLLGHSMGGLIAANFLLEHQADFKGAILSGPAIKPIQEPSTLLLWTSRILSMIAPRLPVAALDPKLISRDPKVVADYLADPLVRKGKIGARMGAELFAAMRNVQSQATKLTLPLLLLHGERDGLTAPEGSKFLMETAGAKIKTLRLYPGLYHEVFNEPERGQVLNEVVQWMDALLGHTPR